MIMSNLEYDSAVWDGAYLIQKLIYMPAADKLKIFGTSVLDKIFDEYFLDDIIDGVRIYLKTTLEEGVNEEAEPNIGDFIQSDEGDYLFITGINDDGKYYFGINEEGDPQVWTFDEDVKIVGSNPQLLTTIANAFYDVGAYNE